MTNCVHIDALIHTCQFSMFKFKLRHELRCSGVQSECYNRIMLDVDRFLHSGERLSNKYRCAYWLCRNEDGGIVMFDSHNHSVNYVGGTLCMTVTVDVHFLNRDGYIIDAKIERYFNSDEV